MKRFIAYFDYLGFKKFIENNDIAEQKRIIEINFEYIERALGQGNIVSDPYDNVMLADLSNSKLNCINFSDTVVFWSNDDSFQSLIEIIEVSYRFNWQAVCFNFPARGALVFDEIVSVDFKNGNDFGGTYNVNSVFGKGLVKAYEKAEKQHWAGTVIEQSFIEKLESFGHSADSFLHKYAKRYKVPYKQNEYELNEEMVFCITEGELNRDAFKNVSRQIKENFGNYNKPTNSKDVQEKIDNTIKFLASFYVKDSQS